MITAAVKIRISNTLITTDSTPKIIPEALQRS
jgi:hypothetical protein